MSNGEMRSQRAGQTLPLLGAALAVLGIGAAGWWYFGHRSRPTPSAAGQAIVEEFLQQLRQGKTDQAWQATAADFKSYQGREAFRAYVGKHPELKQPLEFQRHEELPHAPLAEYVYVTKATAAAKTTRTIKIRLAQEAETWKVESLGIQ